ncbi:MAG: hypothetical protein AVDCRST_MAG88-4225, partial [uncultured Thermomicrobiales bacterium]
VVLEGKHEEVDFLLPRHGRRAPRRLGRHASLPPACGRGSL